MIKKLRTRQIELHEKIPEDLLLFNDMLEGALEIARIRENKSQTNESLVAKELEKPLNTF